jgi:pimeloyl-ACP methyl ester carboxylesterase
MLWHKVIENNKGFEWTVFIHGFGGSSSAFKKQIDEYSKNFNLLLIDLHGHGSSSNFPLNKIDKHSFKSIATDILKVMDKQSIRRAHFVGLSLGSLLIRALSELAPHRVSTMVLAGAVVSYNVKVKMLILLGQIIKPVIPYMLLYRFFALILMPRKNHRRSRSIFVKEAMKIGDKEFFTWFNLVKDFEKQYPPEGLKDIYIPKLFCSGEEDYMFTPLVEKYAGSDKNSALYIIPNCGHISNIDRAEEFNTKSIEFIKSYCCELSEEVEA